MWAKLLKVFSFYVTSFWKKKEKCFLSEMLEMEHSTKWLDTCKGKFLESPYFYESSERWNFLTDEYFLCEFQNIPIAFWLSYALISCFGVFVFSVFFSFFLLDLCNSVCPICLAAWQPDLCIVFRNYCGF